MTNLELTGTFAAVLAVWWLVVWTRLRIASRRERMRSDRVRLRVNEILNQYGNDNWSARR